MQICFFFPSFVVPIFCNRLEPCLDFKTLWLFSCLVVELKGQFFFGVQQLRTLYRHFQSPPWGRFGSFPTSWRSTFIMESFTYQCTSICTGYSSSKQVHWKWCLNASTLDSCSWCKMMKLKVGAKFRNETEVSILFTLAIWRWSCSFTRGICKLLH